MAELAIGFHSVEKILSRRVSDNINISRQLVQEWQSIYNNLRTQFIGPTVQTVTWAKQRYTLPGGGTLQPLDDQWGSPKPILFYDSYDIGLPMQAAGTAYGTNRVSRAKMTLQDLNDLLITIEGQDGDWIFRHVLAAFLDNQSWTYADKDDRIGDLTIRPLANGDTDLYMKSNSMSASTDDHYFGFANAIDEGADNPFPTLKTAISEHPSNNISAANPVICLVATNLLPSIRALADFEPVPNPLIIPGTSDQRANPVIGRYLGYGSEVIGTVDGVVIVEWNQLPSNYIVARPAAQRPFVAMRQHPEPELQGLFREDFSNQPGWIQTSFIRYAGFGVINRIYAAVAYIGNGTYQVPSAYNAPLAV